MILGQSFVYLFPYLFTIISDQEELPEQRIRLTWQCFLLTGKLREHLSKMSSFPPYIPKFIAKVEEHSKTDRINLNSSGQFKVIKKEKSGSWLYLLLKRIVTTCPLLHGTAFLCCTLKVKENKKPLQSPLALNLSRFVSKAEMLSFQGLP